MFVRSRHSATCVFHLCIRNEIILENCLSDLLLWKLSSKCRQLILDTFLATITYTQVYCVRFGCILIIFQRLISNLFPHDYILCDETSCFVFQITRVSKLLRVSDDRFMIWTKLVAITIVLSTIVMIYSVRIAR